MSRGYLARGWVGGNYPGMYVLEPLYLCALFGNRNDGYQGHGKQLLGGQTGSVYVGPSILILY